MKRLMSLVCVGVAVLAFGLGVAVGMEAAKNGIVQWKQSDLKWHAVPGGPIMQADGWKHGTMHCNFQKFPKGFAAPLHTHSHDIAGVVVAGSFGSSAEGQPESLLPPGGFQSVPGGFKHTTKCGADSDCIVFVCQPGPFDLKPAAGDAKKVK